MEIDIHQFEPLFHSWYLDNKLGQGSFGEVYRAWRMNNNMKEYCAIKHISIEDMIDLTADQQAKTLSKEVNFSQELRGVDGFVHFEEVVFYNKRDGTGIDAFIRMELMETLSSRIRMNAMPEAEVIKLGCDICRGLECLEARNILHRDIKPENILVGKDGKYRLGDFGVARSLDADASMSMTVAGTFNYMAPEIYLGKHVNSTADLYSLGLVLYRLTNENHAPFIPLALEKSTFRGSSEALMRRMRGEKIPPPAHASSALAEVILKACAYEPRDRWQSAAEFLLALQSLEQTPDGQRRNSFPGTKNPPTPTRLPVWLIATIAGVCAVIVLFGAGKAVFDIFHTGKSLLPDTDPGLTGSVLQDILREIGGN